jgi:alpha-N-arabinofuranosidase
MTTFTKLSEHETPTISFHPSRRISKLNPNIYAGFAEYVNENRVPEPVE